MAALLFKSKQQIQNATNQSIEVCQLHAQLIFMIFLSLYNKTPIKDKVTTDDEYQKSVLDCVPDMVQVQHYVHLQLFLRR